MSFLFALPLNDETRTIGGVTKALVFKLLRLRQEHFLHLPN